MVNRNSEGVALERTGYRDDLLQDRIKSNWGDGFAVTDISESMVKESISGRHRDWGKDCPATNIDCLLFEFNHFQPVAIIDFKGRPPVSVEQDRTQFSARATTNLADAASIPFFLVYYDNKLWNFIISPVNTRAKTVLPDDMNMIKMSEYQFVRYLYDLRGEPLADSVVKILNKTDWIS